LVRKPRELMIALLAEEQVAITSEWLGKRMVTGGPVHKCEFRGTCVKDEISGIIVSPEYHQLVRNCEADVNSEIRFLSEAIPSPRFHIL